jgi:hypothetical protein
MATLDITDPKYFDPFLKTLKDNTHINNHNENCSLIVFNFGKNHQKDEIRYISKEHENKGYMPYIFEMARRYLVKEVLNNMDNKQLANKIRGCL